MSTDKQQKQPPIRNDGDDLKKLLAMYVAPKNKIDTEKLAQSLNLYDAMKASDITTNSIIDAKTILQVHPELELAKQIVITNILSPKDIISTELNFTCDSELLGSSVSAKLLEIVSDFFKDEKELQKELPDILSDALYITGSAPIVILPENSIDHLINKSEISLEDINGNANSILDVVNAKLGIIEPAENTLTLESFAGAVPVKKTEKSEDRYQTLTALKITIEDNFNILKLPLLSSLYSSIKTKSAVYSSESSNSNDPNAALLNKLNGHLNKVRGFKQEPIRTVKTAGDLSRPTIGHPIELRLPSESVVPVMTPGSKKPFAWLILLDELGYPVKNSVDTDRYAEISSRLRDNKSGIPQQVVNAYTPVGGSFSINTNNDLKRFYKTFSAGIERDIRSKIRNGVNKGAVEFKPSDDMYLLMLSRALEGQATKILFLPDELMTYIAFDHNEYGIGISLLEKNKIISGLRSTLRFVNTVAAVKNSTNNTILNIELDPNDHDPARTVEDLTHSFIAINTRSFPLGANSPSDLLDFIQKVGISVNVTGNPAYPSTKMGVEDKGRSMVRIDNELEEALRKDHLMGVGVTQEMLDLSTGVDYASTAATSNIMFGKRMMTYQDKLCLFIKDYVCKFINNSSILKNKMLEAIKDKIDELPEAIRGIKDNEQGASDVDAAVISAYEAFIGTLKATLPKPDYNSIEVMSDAFTKYLDSVDKISEVIFSAEGMYGLGKDKLEEEVAYLKNSFRGYMARKWMSENGFMDEFLKIAGTGDGNEDSDNVMLNDLGEFSNKIASFAGSLALFTLDSDKKLQSSVDKLEASKPSESVSAPDTDVESEMDEGGDDYDSDVSSDEPPELPEGDDDSTVADKESIDKEEQPENEPVDNKDQSDAKEESDEPEEKSDTPPDLPDLDTDKKDK